MSVLLTNEKCIDGKFYLAIDLFDCMTVKESQKKKPYITIKGYTHSGEKIELLGFGTLTVQRMQIQLE
jgi:hypothetical protein